MRAGLAATRRLVTESPAFACFLVALAVVPFRWLSPFEGYYGNSQLSDAILALAAVLWLFERTRDRDLGRAFRVWQIPLAIYLLLACASMALAQPGFSASWRTVLLMWELAGLSVITADFAADRGRRRLVMRVIVASALATVAVGAVALILFYTGVETGLVGGYGAQLPSSNLYTRIQAGFLSPPLLASFCIFASGVAASSDAGLALRIRVPAQISFALLCLGTVSRGLIGFLYAALLRQSSKMRGRWRVLLPILGAVVSVAALAALTAANRSHAFSTSLDTLGQHPLFGVGPGGLPGFNDIGLPFRAHFAPLNVAATTGIPALIALSAMFWQLWRSRLRPTDIALWSALAGIAIDGLANDIDHYRHLWILVGLLGCQTGWVPARTGLSWRGRRPATQRSQR